MKISSSDTINICIASDDNYAPLVATTIASVCFNTKRNVKFWCLETNISELNKRLIDSMHDRFSNFKIEYITIDADLINAFASNLKTNSYCSASTYSRLFIPNLFPWMEKIIYMDVDVIVKDDIAKLYDIHMKKFLVAAAFDAEFRNTKEWLKCMGMNLNHNYFNAGILMLNPKKLYENGFLNNIKNIANKYTEYITLGDQDLLNKYFDMNYLKLP